MMCLNIREDWGSDRVTSEGLHGRKEGWGGSGATTPPLALEVVWDL